MDRGLKRWLRLDPDHGLGTHGVRWRELRLPAALARGALPCVKPCVKQGPGDGGCTWPGIVVGGILPCGAFPSGSTGAGARGCPSVENYGRGHLASDASLCGARGVDFRVVSAAGVTGVGFGQQAKEMKLSIGAVERYAAGVERASDSSHRPADWIVAPLAVPGCRREG